MFNLLKFLDPKASTMEKVSSMLLYNTIFNCDTKNENEDEKND